MPSARFPPRASDGLRDGRDDYLDVFVEEDELSAADSTSAVSYRTCPPGTVAGDTVLHHRYSISLPTVSSSTDSSAGYCTLMVAILVVFVRALLLWEGDAVFAASPATRPSTYSTFQRIGQRILG